jgi:hypothetical protein
LFWVAICSKSYFVPGLRGKVKQQPGTSSLSSFASPSASASLSPSLSLAASAAYWQRASASPTGYSHHQDESLEVVGDLRGLRSTFVGFSLLPMSHSSFLPHCLTSGSNTRQKSNRPHLCCLHQITITKPLFNIKLNGSVSVGSNCTQETFRVRKIKPELRLTPITSLPPSLLGGLNGE